MSQPDQDIEIEHRYGQGLCYPMAQALHERLGWPIRTLTALPEAGVTRTHPVHSWVQAPDGRALDVSGFHDEDALVARFLSGHAEETVLSEARETHEDGESYFRFLMGCFGVTEQFDERYRDFREIMVAEALTVVDDYVLPRNPPSEDADPAPIGLS
ncbi:hypothetical protein KUV57_13580 [Epibacterium sp. DP7N7-1]|nr:hypothetical protein [Epibacterium sp. DP7N7-1]